MSASMPSANDAKEFKVELKRDDKTLTLSAAVRHDEGEDQQSAVVTVTDGLDVYKDSIADAKAATDGFCNELKEFPKVLQYAHEGAGGSSLRIEKKGPNQEVAVEIKAGPITRKFRFVVPLLVAADEEAKKAKILQVEQRLVQRQVIGAQCTLWSSAEYPEDKRNSALGLPMAEVKLVLSGPADVIIHGNCHLIATPSTRSDFAIKVDGKECGPQGFQLHSSGNNAGRAYCHTTTWTPSSAFAQVRLNAGEHTIQGVTFFMGAGGTCNGAGLLVQSFPVA